MHDATATHCEILEASVPANAGVIERVGLGIDRSRPRQVGDIAKCSSEELAVISDADFNDIENFILTLPQSNYPLREVFVEKNGALDSGMYAREAILPANTVFTTEIHKTRHPYVLSHGDVRVWTRGTGVREIKAHYLGVTEPLTRRLILTGPHGAIWTTFHAVNSQDTEDIRFKLVLPHEITPNRSPETARKIMRMILALQ